MFPGYIYIYKDINQYVHLLFFSGISDNNKPIYRDIDIKNSKIKYSVHRTSAGEYDYKFENKNIIQIKCKLLLLNGKEEIKLLKIK